MIFVECQLYVSVSPNEEKRIFTNDICCFLKMDYIEALFFDGGTLHVGFKSRLNRKRRLQSIEVIKFNAILEVRKISKQH